MNSEIGAEAVHIRPARPDDGPVIATLNDIASDGVSLYIWESLQDEHPGLDLFEIGAERYRRENTEFSYKNCMLAEVGDETAGMLHGWVVPKEAAPVPDDLDPVIRPYAELEAPGTFYVCCLALFAGFRNRGVGTALLRDAKDRAPDLGARGLSLICFEENTGARRLYERHGFEVVDRRAIVPGRHIRVAGDALLMVQRG